MIDTQAATTEIGGKGSWDREWRAKRRIQRGAFEPSGDTLARTACSKAFASELYSGG